MQKYTRREALSYLLDARNLEWAEINNFALTSLAGDLPAVAKIEIIFWQNKNQSHQVL